MRAKSIVLIVIALGCGLVASIGISQVLEQRGKGGASLETVPIYVALADIDINEKLDASHVKVEQWPKDKVPPGAIQKLDDVKDRYARVRLYQGEPLTERKIADSVSNKSIDIPLGYRASSVKVQMDTAVSYLIQPGDRVDIIATFHRGRDIPQTMSVPILRNVRVFAVNSETESEIEDGKPIVAKTVSLLLKEDQDEILSLGSSLGSLRLSLRNPKEVDDAEDDGEKNRRVTLEELLTGRTRGSDDQSKGLLGLFQQDRQPEPQAEPAVPTLPEPPKEKWRLVVLSADGTSTYVWHDGNEEPQLAQPGMFPSQGMMSPQGQPASRDAEPPQEEPVEQRQEEPTEEAGPFDE